MEILKSVGGGHAFCSACRQATVGSIALDARGGLLLVIGRWYYRGLRSQMAIPTEGVYEHLLGVVPEPTGPQSSAQAVRFILEIAATVRHGRRKENSGDGPEDCIDQELLAHCKAGC